MDVVNEFIVLASHPAGQPRAIRVGAICDVCPIPTGTRVYFAYATAAGHVAIDVREPFPTVQSRPNRPLRPIRAKTRPAQIRKRLALGRLSGTAWRPAGRIVRYGLTEIGQLQSA